GEARFDGLEIDLDLRWEITIARSALGASDDAEIDAALAADDTAKGRQLAETARAARPDQAVKDAAWRRVATDATLSNDVARAIADGWRRTIDPSLLAGTVDDYLGMLERVWSERSFTMASLVVRRLFPAPVVDAELARRTRAWLDAHDEPAPLHRLVAEQLSELERALAARGRDAAAERDAAA
ncbi:MAG TPA: ERAP1-like C-terminal domain-containing protein, partial [Agromyces sp.]|nr:ERAP1-like C-terminal domain-containing protein [Agromyces sp.]